MLWGLRQIGVCAWSTLQGRQSSLGRPVPSLRKGTCRAPSQGSCSNDKGLPEWVGDTPSICQEFSEMSVEKNQADDNSHVRELDLKVMVIWLFKET